MPGSILEPGHRDLPMPGESHVASGTSNGLSYVPNRLLLRFKADVSAATRDAILASRGLTVIKSLSSALVVEGTSGMDVLKQTNELISDAAIDLCRAGLFVPNQRGAQ